MDASMGLSVFLVPCIMKHEKAVMSGRAAFNLNLQFNRKPSPHPRFRVLCGENCLHALTVENVPEEICLTVPCIA